MICDNKNSFELLGLNRDRKFTREINIALQKSKFSRLWNINESKGKVWKKWMGEFLLLSRLPLP
jgi:hypothetical protein